MRHAEVALDLGGPRGAGSLTYRVPEDMPIRPGDLVLVPLSKRFLPGVVVRVAGQTPDFPTRPVEERLADDSFLGPLQLTLARWISVHYRAPLFDCLALFLPPGLAARLTRAAREGRWKAPEVSPAPPDPPTLPEPMPGPPLTLPQQAAARRIGDAVDARQHVAFLLHGVTGSGKTHVYLEAVERALRAGRQAIALVSEIALTPATLARFEHRFPGRTAVLHSRLTPAEHRRAWERVRRGEADVVVGSRSALFAPVRRPGLVILDEEHEWTYKQEMSPRYHAREVALWWGQLAKAPVILGSATPDVESYYRAERHRYVLLRLPTRFPRDEREPDAPTPEAPTPPALGAREGGVAAEPAVEYSVEPPSRTYPATPDELSPSSPRRPHPRDPFSGVNRASTPRNDLTPAPGPRSGGPSGEFDAPVVPRGDIDTEAKGEYSPFPLREGGTGGVGGLEIGRSGSPRPLPPVSVVDMRAELKTGNAGIFSRQLAGELARVLERGEQALLFLNRRGTATCVTCRDCGHVLACRRCDVPLVYHHADESLVCHRCNRRRASPDHCPSCGGPRIRYLGLGTQRVEHELAAQFPTARVVRWDRDVTMRRGAHERLWRAFEGGEADVVVGTQMIAKGLDFPRVTLVGVVLADVGLFLPDFRAGERAFQLLTQMAGRTGRGTLGGRAIVQTYTPEHYAIQAAAHHDYAAFYRREIAFRRAHGYPPLGRLVRLVYSGSGEERCVREAARVRRLLEEELARHGIADIELLGPAPCFNRRVRGRERWQIVLRGDRFARLLDRVELPLGWSLDVDPVSLL